MKALMVGSLLALSVVTGCPSNNGGSGGGAGGGTGGAGGGQSGPVEISAFARDLILTQQPNDKPTTTEDKNLVNNSPITFDAGFF